MSSKTMCHTEENRFKNISIGTFVKFVNNGDIHVVKDKRQEILGGVLQETYLFCDNGEFVRKVGHMDQDAPGLEIVYINRKIL